MKKLLAIIIFIISKSLTAQNPVFDQAIILDGTQNAAHYITNCFADNTGILHVSGQFGGICDFDPGTNVQSLSANNGYPCYVARYTNNLELIWVKLFIGNGDSTGLHPTKVFADNENHTIVCGFHNNTFDANPGPNVHTMAGFPFTYSAFIVSLDSLGNYFWSAQFGDSTNHCRIYDMVQSSNGHLFFCGDFNDSIDFDPGPNMQLRVANGNTSGSFVLELDNNGNFIHISTWDNLDILRCIDVDEFDNIYVGGAYQDTTDFDPGPATYMLNSSFASLTGIVLSIDALNNFRWASNFIDVGSITTSVVKDIAYTNNIIGVTGHFNNNIDIDPGNGIHNITSIGNYDHFHVGLGANIGNFIWGGRTGGTQVDDIRSISTDNNGDFWINGISQGNTDLDLDDNDVATYNFGANAVPWIMRISNTGDLLWSGTQGGQFLNGNYDNSITCVNGAIYWMGNVSNSMDLDPIGNSFVTSPNDYYSAFITKLCLPVEATNAYSLCPGDSLFVQGAWQTQAGVYTDVFTRLNGCDSTITTIIYEANLNISLGNDTTFCNGQLFIAINNAPAMNFLWNNGDNTSYLFIDSSGTYVLTATSTNGACSITDSINVIYGLNVDAPFLQNPICLTSSSIALPDGNPTGGIWSGIGVLNNSFDPMVAGLGNFWIYYSYTDSANCSGIDSTNLIIDLCVPVNDLQAKLVNLYPNPAKDIIYIGNYNNQLNIKIYNVYGQIFPFNINQKGEISIAQLSEGIYIMEIQSSKNEVQFLKFMKQK